VEMGFRKIRPVDERLAITGDGVFGPALLQKRGAQIVQQYGIAGTRGQGLALEARSRVPDLYLERLKSSVRQSQLGGLPQDRSSLSGISRREQTFGQREVVKRFPRINFQGVFQMDEALIRPPCLDQQRAQMMVEAGMSGLCFDQNAIGLLRRREAACAMVRKRLLQRNILRGRSVRHGTASIGEFPDRAMRG